MATPMERFDIYAEGHPQECTLEIEANPQGDWVKADDACTRIAELKGEVKTMREALAMNRISAIAICGLLDHHPMRDAFREERAIQSFERWAGAIIDQCEYFLTHSGTLLGEANSDE